MNISASEVRQKLAQAFDANKGFFGRKVAKTALLRDLAYFVPDRKDVVLKVLLGRHHMADILNVDVNALSKIHTGANGRFDCDNYAILGCAIAKALHDVACRESGHLEEEEYAMWPMARNDMDHTQAICLSDEGFLVIEWITGWVRSAELVKPDIYLIG